MALPTAAPSVGLLPLPVVVLAIAIPVLGAMAARAWLSFSAAIPAGMDAAYYPYQSLFLLEHGRLAYNDMPLIFWLGAGLTWLLEWFGVERLRGAMVASQLIDSGAQPLAAVFVGLLARRWIGPVVHDSARVLWWRKACAGVVIGAAATLAVLHPSMLRMVGDFEKNALALVWIAGALWAALSTARVVEARQTHDNKTNEARRSLLISCGWFALFVGLTAITHVGTLGVLGLCLFFAGVCWCAAIARRRPRLVLILVGVGSALVVAAWGAVYLFDSHRAMNFLKLPSKVFASAQDDKRGGLGGVDRGPNINGPARNPPGMGPPGRSLPGPFMAGFEGGGAAEKRPSDEEIQEREGALDGPIFRVGDQRAEGVGRSGELSRGGDGRGSFDGPREGRAGLRAGPGGGGGPGSGGGGGPGGGQSVWWIYGIAGTALATVLLLRRVTTAASASVGLGCAAAAVVMVAPIWTREYSMRLSLMASFPAAIAATYILCSWLACALGRGDAGSLVRRSRVRLAVGIATLLGATAVTSTTLAVGLAGLSTPRHQVVSEQELTDLRELSAFLATKHSGQDKQRLLVVARHGLEWWAGYILGTPVRLDKVPEDAATKYDYVYILAGGSNERGPRGGPPMRPWRTVAGHDGPAPMDGGLGMRGRGPGDEGREAGMSGMGGPGGPGGPGGRSGRGGGRVQLPAGARIAWSGTELKLYLVPVEAPEDLQP